MTCHPALNIIAGLLVGISFAAQATTFQKTEYGYYDLRNDSQEIYQLSLTTVNKGKQLEVNMSDSTHFRYRAAVVHCKTPGETQRDRHVFMLKPLFYQPDTRPHIGDIQNSYLSYRPMPMWIYPTLDNQQVLVGGSSLKLILMLDGTLAPLPPQDCDGQK